MASRFCPVSAETSLKDANKTFSTTILGILEKKPQLCPLKDS